MKREKVLTAAFVLALAVLVSPSIAKEIYTFPDSQTVKVGDHPVLELTNPSGMVRVTSHSENTIRILAMKRVKARGKSDAEELAGRLEIEIKSHPELVEVQTVYPKDKDRDFWGFLFGERGDSHIWVDYELYVPKNCELRLETTSGDVMVTKVDGNHKLNTTSGDITLKVVRGDLAIDATSGDILVSRTEGKVDIDVTSGDIRLDETKGDIAVDATSGDLQGNDLTGNVSISSTSGDVRLSGVTGDVKIDGLSSDIVVSQLEGGATVNTTSGDISVSNETLSGTFYSFESTSGDVRFTLPGKKGGRVDLNTVSGSITAKMPVTLETFSNRKLLGYINPEGPEIRIQTTSGDVVISEE